MQSQSKIKAFEPTETLRPINPAFHGHEVQIADRGHDPRIGFLLGGDQQRPVCRVCNILKQVDRRESAADDPDSACPSDGADKQRSAR